MRHTIAVLEGDGIGPEIMAPTLELLDAVTGDLDYHHLPVGGASIDLYDTALTDHTLAACRQASAILLAAVGGPKWDTTDPSAPRPEDVCSVYVKSLVCLLTCARSSPCQHSMMPAR